MSSMICSVKKNAEVVKKYLKMTTFSLTRCSDKDTNCPYTESYFKNYIKILSIRIVY